MKIYSFPPIWNSDCKILILGSMPGKESLLQEQYYAHTRNSFWRILFSIFNEELSIEYANRKQLLKIHNIALWDVLQHCEREGSLDSAIKNEVPNSIIELIQKSKNLKAVFFNGQKSAASFKKWIGFSALTIPYHILPSTSPAHAGLTFQKKLEVWESEISGYLLS